MNVYRWIWTRIGGRPWTYIIRDVWHKAEFVWIVCLVSLGMYIGHNCDFRSILIIWLIFSIGYLFGHLFWGKDYISGQKED